MTDPGSPTITAKTVTVLDLHPWLRLGVEAWELRGPGRDAILVTAHETLARVAVLAGATLVPGATSPMGTDEGRYAAAISRTALEDDTSARAALEAAGRFLHDPDRGQRRAQAASEAVVATITRHGTEVVVAGGGAAFVRRDEDWHALSPDAPLTDDAADAWRAWIGEHPEATPADRAEAELRLLGTEDRWRNPRVGAFDTLRPEVVTIEHEWSEIVLASAGARLDVSLLGRLEGWIAGLRAWEAGHEVALGRGGALVHGDATVVRLRRLPLAGDEAPRASELAAGPTRRPRPARRG